jgi:hypothetical protein
MSNPGAKNELRENDNLKLLPMPFSFAIMMSF